MVATEVKSAFAMDTEEFLRTYHPGVGKDYELQHCVAHQYGATWLLESIIRTKSPIERVPMKRAVRYRFGVIRTTSTPLEPTDHGHGSGVCYACTKAWRINNGLSASVRYLDDIPGAKK